MRRAARDEAALLFAARARTLTPPSSRALARGVAPLFAGVVFAAILELAVRPAIGPFYTKVLMDIGINVVLAVSLNIVNGLTGQFSIGHAAFMAVGGYTAGAITYYGSFRLWNDAATHGGLMSGVKGAGLFAAGDLLFLGACLAGALVAAVAGILVGLPSLRLRGDYLAIVTLGFGEIVRVLLQQTNANVPYDAAEIRALPWTSLVTRVGGSLGFTGIPFYTTLFWSWLFVVFTLTAAFRLKRSSYGRAFLSIREDEVAAEAMGVPTTRCKVQAFVLAAFFAGIAGGLFAHEVGTTLNPRELGFLKSFDVIIMVVLGGMGSISGAALAAVILTVLPELLRAFSQYRMVVYALSLIVMMIVRPQGLFGLHEIWEVGPVRRWLARRRA